MGVRSRLRSAKEYLSGGSGESPDAVVDTNWAENDEVLAPATDGLEQDAYRMREYSDGMTVEQFYNSMDTGEAPGRLFWDAEARSDAVYVSDTSLEEIADDLSRNADRRRKHTADGPNSYFDGYLEGYQRAGDVVGAVRSARSRDASRAYLDALHADSGWPDDHLRRNMVSIGLAGAGLASLPTGYAVSAASQQSFIPELSPLILLGLFGTTIAGGAIASKDLQLSVAFRRGANTRLREASYELYAEEYVQEHGHKNLLTDAGEAADPAEDT